jgi:hypothetical protein
LPKYANNVWIGTDKSKWANDTTILIDDADHNINPFIDNEGIGILVPRKWNSLHEWSHCTIEHLEKVLEI